MSNGRSFNRWKLDRKNQTRLIVSKLNLCLMQACHCVNQTEAKPRTRLTTAFIETHKALQDPRAIFLGNTLPVITYRKDNRARIITSPRFFLFAASLDRNMDSRHIGQIPLLLPVRLRSLFCNMPHGIFEGIVDKIGNRPD